MTFVTPTFVQILAMGCKMHTHITHCSRSTSELNVLAEQ